MRASRQRGAGPLPLLALLLAGCAADLEAAAPSDRDLGPDQPPSFTLEISRKEPAGTPRPGSTVILEATASELVGRYRWTVIDSGDEPITALDHGGDGKLQRIAFKVSRLGTQTASCTASLADGTEQTQQISVQVEDPDAPRRSYLVRILPPGGKPHPPKDLDLEVAGADKRGLVWTVEEGLSKKLEFISGGKSADVYLRLFRDASDPYPRDALLLKGAGTISLSQSFHALLVPLDAPVAPLLRTNLTAAALGATWKEDLSAGEPVDGTVQIGAEPLAGARVSIEVQDPSGLPVPSTVPTTSGDGTFRVLSRVGQGSMVIVPPAASALPIAIVEGMRVPGPYERPRPAAPIFAYVDSPAARVRAQLRLAGGSGIPKAGAVVVLSAETLTNFGSLVQGCPLASCKVVGRHRQRLVSGADGALRDPATGAEELSLPAGTYSVEVWPAQGESPDQGYARVSRTLTSGASQTAIFALGKRVTVTGAVRSSDDQGIRMLVTASSSSGSFSAVSGASGDFALRVDDQASYTLTARPYGPASTRMGMYRLTSIKVAGDAAVGTVTLPLEVLVSGVVRTTSGDALAGALIRIWCRDPSCPSPDLLDQVQASVDGSFTLRIPLTREAP